MTNAELRRLAPGETHLATRGRGLEARAVEVGEVSGTDTRQVVDTPALYARLSDRQTGAELGVYLFSLRLGEQEVTAGGKTYAVALRFKQSRKPYSLRLKQFTFKRYPGTEVPREFTSTVVLLDPERGDNREVAISMNRPLRHRGDTFFQADWNKETEKGTVLQVVRNPAWQLPYWSCALVSVGLLIHFGLNLVNFLGRRAAE